ncbi:MAG: 3-carboxy-cis,cis-muconate cycloisomerase [Rhizobiaceae bacterium]
MTFSPFDHPFLAGLLGDEEIAGYFSADADVRAMLAFEAALANAQAECAIIPPEAATHIAAVSADFAPDFDRLRVATSHDGVVVPELIRQLRAAVEPHARWVHFGATSQDVIDSSLMLRLKPVLAVLDNRIGVCERVFDDLERRFGRNRLMARTRMQPAIEITAVDRIHAWREPLGRIRDDLNHWRRDSLAIQFGGAAGTLEKLDERAAAVRAALARVLDLADAPQWHSQRDRIAGLAGILSLVSGCLGKFGQDVALLAQEGDEIQLAGGGGSSAMPHKQNPIAAEVLIALARFNATQLAGMHQALLHEQERSGAAWTLEWLILPQMVAGTAASLRLAVELGANIRTLGKAAEA